MALRDEILTLTWPDVRPISIPEKDWRRARAYIEHGTLRAAGHAEYVSPERIRQSLAEVARQLRRLALLDSASCQR